MERARLHALDAERGQPLAHLPGRAGGERDRERAARVVLAGERGVGDAVGDGPGLARARAGEHHHRPRHRQGHLALLRVEGGQHGVRAARPRGRADTALRQIEEVVGAHQVILAAGDDAAGRTRVGRGTPRRTPPPGNAGHTGRR